MSNSHSNGAAGDDVPPLIAFLGDSLTAGFDWSAWLPNARVVNFAVNGATTDDVLQRFGDVVDTHPDEIVLMAGTNDLGQRSSVEHVVRNIQLMMVELRRELPGVRMLVQSIPPRQQEFAARIREANIHLRQFCATVKAQYLDLWPALAADGAELNPDFSTDGLHLNDAGYQAWLAELHPALERLSEAPPMTRPLQVVRQSG